VIVDAHMLLGENRFGPTLEVPDALALCERLGIDKPVARPPGRSTTTSRLRTSD
jgi:hypothetical protein